MKTKKPSVILFDVNETMLDMSPLQNKINHILRSKRGFRIWFGMLLHHSLVDNCTSSYHDFSTIADATLGMAAKAVGADIDEKSTKEALATMKQLPAYPDVEKGLKLLQKAGYRLATLTNSPPETQVAQLEFAELLHFFEQTLSIDAVKKYKPAVETYQYAATTLSVDTEDILMVAAHGWDLAGAHHAGTQTAFIERKSQSLYPLAPAPTYSGKNLVEIAQAVLKSHQ